MVEWQADLTRIGGPKIGPMASRDDMLARIRKALGRESPKPEAPSARDLPPLGIVMPPVPPEQLVPKFETEWTNVGGSAYRALSREELEDIIRRILEASQATSVVLSGNPLLSLLRLEERLRAKGISVAAWLAAASSAGAGETPGAREFKAAGFAAAVGITGVDFALAETGSLVLSSRTEGSQLASLAPPVHVALYRRDQVVESLDEVLEKLPISRDPNTPSPGWSVVFVTGPSRTADIEQILVRGVHGPGEVHAILVEDTCLA